MPVLALCYYHKHLRAPALKGWFWLTVWKGFSPAVDLVALEPVVRQHILVGAMMGMVGDSGKPLTPQLE